MATADISRPGEDMAGGAGVSPLAAWWSVAVLWLFYTVSFVDRYAIGLFVEPIRKAFSISDFQVSLLQGFAFALFYALFSLPIGWLVDRYSKRAIMFTGIVAWSVAASATGLARSYAGLLLCRVGVGAGEGSLAPSAYALLPGLFPKKRLALPMSIMGSGAKLGGAVAVLAGGYLIAVLPPEGLSVPLFGWLQSWQVCMVLIGVPGLLLAPLIFTVAEPRVRAGAPSAAPGELWSHLRLHRRFYTGHFLGFAMVCVVASAIMGWMPTFMIRRFGMGIPEAGKTAGAVMLAGSLLGGVLTGLIVDAWYSRGRSDAHLRFYAINVFVQAAAICVAMFSPSLPLALAALLLQQVLVPFTGVAAAGLQIYAPPHLRGRISAIYVAVFNLIGVGLGPSAVAAFTDYVFHDDMAINKSLACTAVIFSLLAAGWLTLAMRPMRERARSGSAA